MLGINTPRWAVKLGDAEYRLDGLPIKRLQQIADAHGVGWRGLIHYPLTDALAYVALVALICELHPEAEKVELPGEDSPASAAEALCSLLVAVKDDIPSMFDVEVDDNDHAVGARPLADGSETVTTS